MISISLNAALKKHISVNERQIVFCGSDERVIRLASEKVGKVTHTEGVFAVGGIGIKGRIKVIKDELGETKGKEEEIIEYKNKVKNGNFPLRIKKKLESEIERYNATSEMSPDSGVIRNYIDYLLSVPWYTETKDEKDLVKIEKKLNASHYGMDKAKMRIIEYIAVKSIAPDVISPIICLVGPPGVGKTTFAESISIALNIIRRYE